MNRAYGLANLELRAPISPSTVFDIGSTQKQFIAAAILLLVEEGRLSLADDIHAYIPELPDYGHTITIDHLLTHTSGLRDWTALLQLSSESEDALTMILRQRGLNFAPGEEWSYSNSGYVLLKEIVARTTGMPFSAFAQERLFEPLGMAMTIYADDVRDVADRALAYEKEGGDWRLSILVGNERGDGGALLSTAGDLLIWNEALTNASLGAWVSEKLQEPARLNNGRELSYARGLFLDKHPASTVVWHSGSAAGYKSLLARLPELGLSFAILCNSGEGALGERFANRIIELFTAATQEPDAEAASVLPGCATEDSRRLKSPGPIYPPICRRLHGWSFRAPADWVALRYNGGWRSSACPLCPAARQPSNPGPTPGQLHKWRIPIMQKTLRTLGVRSINRFLPASYVPSRPARTY